MAAAATLYVCLTCKGQGEADPDAPRPGAQLFADLQANHATADPGATFVVKGVECLSACQTGCTVALSAPGKWTYVYGRLDPAEHVDAILSGAALYAQTPDGIVPWRARPEIFRKQSIARIPPQETADE